MHFERLLPLLALTTLCGCVLQTPYRPEPDYRPTYPELPPPQSIDGASLYQVGYTQFLFDDRRAARVGDVVTIILEESTSASKSAETSYEKESSQNTPEPILFGSLIKGLAENAGIINSWDSDTEFDGEAESDQSNSLSGTISAVVAAVYPNGLLQVQGEKWLNLNRGEEYIRVSGLVRSEDVDGENQVSSLRLADARIAYSGTGTFADTNNAGWLSKFFISPLMPF